MGAWNSIGVLTAEDKQVFKQPAVTELGVRIDGTGALLGSSPERLLKTCFATIFHLKNKVWSKKRSTNWFGKVDFSFRISPGRHVMPF